MKLKSILLLPVLGALSLSSCSGTPVRHNVEDYKAGELTFKSGRESFNILQLTDIHLSNKDNQQLQLDFLNLTITDAVNKGLDLIVLCGDLFTFADKVTVERFFKFVDSYNIPWTATFGNHDEQGYFSVTWLTSYLNNYGSNCVFKDLQDDDIHGNANFYIDVKKDNDLFERVILLDSNRYYFSDYMGYDYIKRDQVDWYERVIDDDPTVESLMFFHIPLPEFLEVRQKYEEHGESEDVQFLGGQNFEGVSCPKYNSGLFDTVVKLGSTKGIFVGHDHENDTAYRYKGVTLSYGTNSTDRIYSHTGMIGGQLISLYGDHTFDLTRIHHEYKEVEGK